jgi:hypothetical protein
LLLERVVRRQHQLLRKLLVNLHLRFAAMKDCWFSAQAIEALLVLRFAQMFQS